MQAGDEDGVAVRSAVSAGRRFRDEVCMLSKDLQHGGRFVGRPKFSERLYGYDKPIGEHTIANGRGNALDDSRQVNIVKRRGWQHSWLLSGEAHPRGSMLAQK